MNEEVKKRKTFDLFMHRDAMDNIYLKLVKKRYRKILRASNILYVLYTLYLIKKHSIDVVVFNTIDSYNEDISLLLSLLPEKTKKIGVIHNGELVDEFYGKYDKVLVLSELIHDTLKKNKVEYIYTLLYRYKNNLNIVNKKEFLVCIPGNIEETRRDYEFIVKFVATYKNFCNANQIKFMLLGNINSRYGQKIKKMITEKGIEDLFYLYYEFIGYDYFMKYIVKSDIIMPLIHRRVINFSAYRTNKISDAFNMAFSCNKPLLMHQDFSEEYEFKRFGFFYKDHHALKGILQTLALNRGLVAKKAKEIKEEGKFSYDYQSKKYMNLLRT